MLFHFLAFFSYFDAVQSITRPLRCQQLYVGEGGCGGGFLRVALQCSPVIFCGPGSLLSFVFPPVFCVSPVVVVSFFGSQRSLPMIYFSRLFHFVWSVFRLSGLVVLVSFSITAQLRMIYTHECAACGNRGTPCVVIPDKIDHMLLFIHINGERTRERERWRRGLHIINTRSTRPG